MVLQQALRTLCSNTGWCYAVFWKLKRRSRIVLTWEDGYCEYKKPLTTMPTNLHVAGNCLETGGNAHPRVCGQWDYCLQEQISLALATLSYQVYALGEGIIGQVAFSGKYQWIHSAGINYGSNGGNCGSKSQNVLEKYPDAWQNQFTAGIKTVAVIHVLQGVVQLGSMEMIMEDLNLVHQIKLVFGSLQGAQGAFHSKTVSEGQGRKRHTQSTVILPIGKNPNTSMERSGIMQQTHSGQRPLDNVSGGTVNRLEYGLLNKIGLSNESSDSQAPFSLSKVNLAKTTVGELQPQQSFLQLSSCNNLESLPSDLKIKPHYTFADRLEANVSTPGMMQLVSFNTPVAKSDFTSVEQVAVEEACPLEKRTSSYREIIPCLAQQALGDASMTSAQMDTRKLMDEVAGQNHQVTLGSVLEVLQWNAASSSTDIATAYDHTCGKLKYQPLAEEFQTNLPLAQNMGSESHNHSLFQSIGCCKSSTLHKGQPSSSTYSLRTDPIPCLEGITSKFDSPTSHITSGVSRSMLDCKGWDRDGTVYSIPQNIAKILGQSKWDVPDVQSMCSDVPRGTEYNCIDTGELDALKNYMMSFANQKENLKHPFPMGDELSEALGPALKKQHKNEFWEEVLIQISGENSRGGSFGTQNLGFSSVTCQTDTEIAQSWGSNKNELSKGENKSDSLLDAVIGTPCINHASLQILDNDYSCKAAFSESEIGLSMLNFNLTKKAYNAGTDHMQGDSTSEDKRDHLHTCMISESQEGVPLLRSVENLSMNAILNSWLEEGQCKMSSSVQHSQVKKPDDDMPRNNKKRARPGEISKPRPKDRQKIQDCIQELRQIIPNGSKCSIDALLEKTIKHMHILRSVIQHADKLKQIGELKVSAADESMPAHSAIESGASWVLELGGQKIECPITVENLNPPRHMRVEMLCEERGLFLEIADLIKSLGLIIMKGIMESRGDKIWARFIVEADRDVHRIEILWSLVQLLQPSLKIGTCVTSQAVSDVPSSMDISPETYCSVQQVSPRPFSSEGNTTLNFIQSTCRWSSIM